MIETKKEVKNIGKYNEKEINNFENLNLKNFFSENFSDSKILQKNFTEKFKNFFNKPEKKSKNKIVENMEKDFSHLKLLNFLFKIKTSFLEKKISFNSISFDFLKMNLKDFDEIFLEVKKKISDKKDFSEIDISLKNEKEYLEIANCDLIFDIWEDKEIFKITLQTDEFLKMIS